MSSPRAGIDVPLYVGKKLSGSHATNPFNDRTQYNIHPTGIRRWYIVLPKRRVTGKVYVKRLSSSNKWAVYEYRGEPALPLPGRKRSTTKRIRKVRRTRRSSE